ncbi:hypothetical protein [Pontibacter diazotrophicus]|nr:hypothetical protein [Pontibacter diazotrophicus]
MSNNITCELVKFETMVSDGVITSFWVSVRSHGLWLQAAQSAVEQIVPLEKDMFNSLSTFFYGVEKIEYRSHDYTNLKCFVNARVMLDRLLNKEDNGVEDR